MRAAIKTFVCLSALTFLGLPAIQASAATSCKPALTAKGMYYTTKAKSQDSAKYRWGLKAAATHGANWGVAGQAKGKSYKCTYGHGKSGKLYNCTLTAKPCRQITACKGNVSAKGMFYTTKQKARESAQYRWSLASAERHGTAFAHWNKAKNKSLNCSYGHGKSGKLYNCRAKAKACN